MPTISVEGMSCEHCEQTVEDAVREIPGVTRVTADEAAQQVDIDGDADIDAVLQAIEDAGYTAHA
jgi:copper ion binding protein